MLHEEHRVAVDYDNACADAVLQPAALLTLHRHEVR